MTLDGPFTSMIGPSQEQKITLGKGERELVWIVGYEAELISSKSGSAVPDRFMCHVSVDLQKEAYQQRLAPRLQATYRLVTLSQGLTKVDFPTGFGMPIPSDQLLWIRSQLLNLNDEKIADNIQFKIKFHYLRDKELQAPIKPLFLVRAPVVKSLEPGQNHFGGVKSSAGCSVGVNANPDDYLEYDSKGQAFIPHWKLPPGREETKTLITERLSLPDDMTVHAIVSHVHPSAESLTLIDLTTLDMVYQARTNPNKERLALDSISTYSSEVGLALKKDHDYGLVSVYDNQTDRELDSMAVMYLYLHDPEFLPPTTAELNTLLPQDAVLENRQKDKVVWRSHEPLRSVNSLFESDEKWRLKSESSNGIQWEGPSGFVLIEPQNSGCLLSLTFR